MLNEQQINNREKQLETVLVIAVGLLFIFLITKKTILVPIAFGVGFLGLASKTIAKWVTWFWYKLAATLGYVNSRILLTIIFYIFLLPIALLARLFVKDNLQLRKKKAEESYYIKRKHVYQATDFEKMW